MSDVFLEDSFALDFMPFVVLWRDFACACMQKKKHFVISLWQEYSSTCLAFSQLLCMHGGGLGS